jgi:transposase
MPMVLKVRTLTSEEQQAIERLAHSRTASAREVERARIVWHASQGLRVPAIATLLHIHQQTVRLWLKRFNEAGPSALQDLPRSGAPPTYSPEEVSEVIATSLTDPQTLGLPFACWTMDRLEAYLNEEKGILIKRSRISDLLIAEGLRWRTQETWFGERAQFEGEGKGEGKGERKIDPDFAQKRGSSRPSTLRTRTRAHLRVVR